MGSKGSKDGQNANDGSAEEYPHASILRGVAESDADAAALIVSLC